ncbi:hypothetical protein ACFL3H_06020 [Gemmatimonadota bacterium]
MMCASARAQSGANSTAISSDGAIIGTFTLGYSGISTFESNADDNVKGKLLRADMMLLYRDFLFEADVQNISFDQGNSRFLYTAVGYRIISEAPMPEVYLLAGYLSSERFPLEGLVYNKGHNGFGIGGMFRMEVETLLNSEASFAWTYFPQDGVSYKSMHVGWEIKKIGISIGGVGIRVPDGRFYGGYVFALRYKW